MDILADRGDSFQKIVSLLEDGRSADPEWEARLEALLAREENLYSSLLRLLAHLDYSDGEARAHWQAIREHRQELSRRLGRDAGLRLALLDYFLYVHPVLRNPKVIEIATFLATEKNALTDHLTGLYNRQYFDASLRREAKRAQRYDLTFSLVLLDLDDFKAVNDRYGHRVGDEALRSFAAIVRRSVREIDFACRYGGEEFALILPETSRCGAYIVAERIRADVEVFIGKTAPGGVPATLTVSGGVAIYPADAATAEELIDMADRALYRSKREGKNRITLHAEEKRRSPRFELARPISFEPVTPARSGELQTKNFSRNGALLESRVPLHIGTELCIRIQRPRKDYALKGRVVRLEEVERGPGKHYDVAIAFVAESDEEQRQIEGLTQELASTLAAAVGASEDLNRGKSA